MNYQTNYHFFGANTPAVTPKDPQFGEIRDQRDLYEILRTIWCRETCAPRLRDRWSEDNPTLGQCSVTAFLAQDVFGGKVFGIPLGDGHFHCYNSVGDVVFDLTSEQFPAGALVYGNDPEQFREVHFASEEKRLRYEYLKAQVTEICRGRR